MDLDLFLTPHFQLREFAITTHREFGELNADGAAFHVEPLRAVAEMLEVVRAHFDRPIIVHSGYRTPMLNAHIGGSRNSQHCLGQAADCHVAGIGLEEAWTWIRDHSGLLYGQLILEGRAAVGQWGWIHASLGEPYRPAARCRQAFKMEV